MGWENQLQEVSERRQAADGNFSHMATPDAQMRLAYADVTDLFKTIDSNWELFKPSLLEKTV
jgi:hypothetical protein